MHSTTSLLLFGRRRSVALKLWRQRVRRLDWRQRRRLWTLHLALHHPWFRMLLHVRAAARRPGNLRWHLGHLRRNITQGWRRQRHKGNSH